MAIDKTKGDLLYFSQWGGERPIPPEFVAAMERAEERQSGYAVDAEIPKSIKDDPDVVEAFFDPRERRTNEKVLVVIRKKNGVIGPLRDIRTTDNGQSVQVEATMFRGADATFTIAEATATQDVSVKDLGNGWSIQEVAISGTYIAGVFTPGIFQGIELTTRREDPMPGEFRLGLPLTEVQSVVSGTVAQPTLGANDLEAKERQIAQHKKLLTRLTRDGVTLPFSLVHKRTNDKKQLVLVVDTYRIVDTTPTISTTQDVKVLDLGEGHEVVTTEVIPALFGQEHYERQIDDVIPERFKADLPTSRTRQIVAGTAAIPTLSAGDLMRSEEQITVLSKLTEVLTRANITLPAIFVDTATITEYGGGTVNITATINTTALTVDTGEGIVNSKVTNLGNSYKLKETIARVAGAWPVLPGARVDHKLHVLVTFTEQVVANGSTTPSISGDVETTVEPVDFWREKKIVTTFPTSAIDAYVRTLHANTNIDLPAELVSLTGYMSKRGESGSYSENGNYAIAAGGGSSGIALHGSAQASAAVLGELGFDIKEPRGDGLPCRHVLMLVANGETRANIRTRLGTILGNALNGSPTVNEWPRWSPRQLAVLMRGEKVSIEINANVRAHDSVVQDYLGVVKSNSWQRSQGSGGRLEVGLDIKIIRIGPTVHSALTISGAASDTVSAAASCAISCTNGASISTGAVGITANGSLGIVNASATPGTANIPTGGWYLHRLVPQADADYDRLMVFAEVIDFGLIPSG